MEVSSKLNGLQEPPEIPPNDAGCTRNQADASGRTMTLNRAHFRRSHQISGRKRTDAEVYGHETW